MGNRIQRRSQQRAHGEYAPQRNAIQRGVREGKRELGSTTRAIDRSYGGALAGINELGRSIIPDTRRTVRGLNQGLGQTADLLGGGGSAGATAAAGLTSGSIVGGTLGDIWRGARASQGYNQGMAESTVADEQRMHALARENYQAVLEEARNSREALAASESARAAEIADEMRERMQAKRLANWLEGYFKDLLGKGRGGGGGGGLPDLTDVSGNAIYYPGGAGRAAIQHGYGVPVTRAPAVRIEEEPEDELWNLDRSRLGPMAGPYYGGYR